MSVAELRSALAATRAAERTTVVLVETDPTVPSAEPQAGWDVPVAEVSALEPACDARATCETGPRSPRLPLRLRATR
jgi:3D-(3,5/4)-trihydroxycyclohexane-1,2-dione acylhydrolase (decyclizing)